MTTSALPDGHDSKGASLDEVLTPVRRDDGRFELRVEDGWQQGRGAFGGLVLGGMVRAIEASEPDAGRRLRSLTAEIVGPVQVGAAEIEVELLRRGNAVSTLRAVLRQGGEVQAHAVAVLGAAREAPGWQRLTPPAPERSWREVEPIPGDNVFAPTFTQHFEYRSIGPYPFQGVDVAEASGWVRPRRPVVRRDAGYMAAMADAWWLAGAATFVAPRPFATVAFSLELIVPPEGLDPALPFFHRATAPVSSDGYVSEYRELWGSDGRLLALNHQVMVIIK